MEKPFYLKTTNKQGKSFNKEFGMWDKENYDLNKNFPQKRQKRQEFSYCLPEGIEKFYTYVDKVERLFNVKTDLSGSKNLFNFAQALNEVSALNSAQLKVCENFGIKFEILDSDSSESSNQFSDNKSSAYSSLAQKKMKFSNSTQLTKVCENFNRNLKLEDSDFPAPSENPTPTYISLKSFQSLLPITKKPWKLPIKLSILHLKPSKYSKQDFKTLTT